MRLLLLLSLFGGLQTLFRPEPRILLRAPRVTHYRHTVGTPNQAFLPALDACVTPMGAAEQSQLQICKVGARDLSRGRRKRSTAGSERALQTLYAL